MTSARRRVMITGMGVVSAAGCDLVPFWNQLVSGRSTVGPIRRFDPSGYPSRIASEIDPDTIEALKAPDSNGSDWPARGHIALFAAHATSSAIRAAGLDRDPLIRARAGLALAAGMGSYRHTEVFRPCAAGGTPGRDFEWRRFTPVALEHLGPYGADRRTPGSIASRLACEHALGGPVLTVMTACSGGTQAIGDAARWIRSGHVDVAIAVGSDSELYPMGLASFCLLRALSTRNDDPTRASRPFDASRDGFVLGEGAGALVLEELEHARRRSAPLVAEVAGFGSACDAYRVTDPHPDGQGAVLAMTRALADAGLTPGEVGYINAHGTSTPANDRIEARAIRRVFGGDVARVAISSTKSMIGHATVAAGAIEAIVTALTLAHQTIHPTINFETADPGCDLDYVPATARRGRVEAALSNSFAFGGQSACVVMRRWNG
jgi:3-oxoacyl-[acyl-carrier-protein] synthase II